MGDARGDECPDPCVALVHRHIAADAVAAAAAAAPFATLLSQRCVVFVAATMSSPTSSRPALLCQPCNLL